MLKKEIVFVYICRNGDNEELRYSLRSAQTFYPNSTVWVVGGKPDWYVGNFIPIKQVADAFQNVKNSLIAIMDNPNIPDEIVIMNDDFFFVRYVPNIKAYSSGTLYNKIVFNKSNGVNSPYIKRLNHLLRHCKKYRDVPLDFETHAPMLISKSKLSIIAKENVMWRSNYGNRFLSEDQIEVIDDVKVYSDPKYGFKSYEYLSFKYPFFSTQDSSFGMAYDRMLKNMFCIPSRYELKVFSSS